MNHSTSSEESMQDGQLETTNQGEQESHKATECNPQNTTDNSGGVVM